MDFYAERDLLDNFWLTVIWVIVTMVVPICFWIPLVFKKSMYFCFAELLLNGSLTIYVIADLVILILRFLLFQL